MAAPAGALRDADAHVPPPARDVLVGCVALVAAGLVGAGIALGFHLDNLHNGLIGASFTAVGLYVVRVLPGHREGWLFVVTGLLHVVMFAGRQYGLHPGELPGVSWLGWVGVWPLPLAIAVAGVTVMAFPDGHFLSPAWRRAAVAMLTIGAALSVATALWPLEYDRVGLVAPHPFSVPGSARAEAVVGPLLGVSYAGFQVVWTAAVVVRMRRARGDTARQLRWFVYAASLDLVALVLGLVLLGSPVPGALGVPFVAVAAGLAIVKHRLYDIDPVIDRTLVVAAMAVCVTGGYVAVVMGIGALVPAPQGLLALLATALVALAFEPLRHRVQQGVDRLVYGHRTTPYETLARLSNLLDSHRGNLLDGLAAAVAHGVGATEVVVYADPAGLRPEATWPDPPLSGAPGPLAELADLPGPRWHVHPIHHGGVRCGALALRKRTGEALTAAEKRLLADLLSQAGLVIDHQAQAVELRAAARRVVTAQDAARRRLERDLHDGAQQRLVTLGAELGGLAALAQATGDDELAARVETARSQLLDATAELREMARGIHPAVLTQDGLTAALGTLADRAALPTRLDLDLGRRLRPEVEASAYFLASEAITNAARHSGATAVTVSARLDGDVLRVEVCDDGRGGAVIGDGSGLQGLSDRLTALGARLVVEDVPGGGTRLRTEIPCA